jgi:hypothetical protein
MTPARSHLAALGLAAATLATLALTPVATRAAGSSPVHASLLYPVATSQDPDLSTNVSLSILYGRLGHLGGVGVSGVVTLIHHGASGLLVTGGVAGVGGDFRGVALTGLLNTMTGEMHGLQFAGLANIQRGSTTGIQAASFFNFAQDGLRGAQLAGALNMHDGVAGAVQLAGVGNVNSGDLGGLQVSGGFNYAPGRMSGGQAALVNAAGDVHGAQLGLANFAATVRGVTIGAVNMCDRHDGVPIGFVNLARDNGSVDLVIEAGTLVPISAGVKTVVNRFSSIFAAGYGDPEGEVTRTGALSWHPGYEIWRGGPWTGTLELGYIHYMPDYVADPAVNDRLHFALEARGRIERRLTSAMTAYAGVGIGRWYNRYDNDPEGKTLATAHAGIALF